MAKRQNWDELQGLGLRNKVVDYPHQNLLKLSLELEGDCPAAETPSAVDHDQMMKETSPLPSDELDVPAASHFVLN